MRRLLREQDQVGAAPIALTILRDANTGAGQDPHRPDCGGSIPPSCRGPSGRAPGLQALQRCSGLLSRRARGSTVATHHFLPAWLSSDSSSFVNCRANPPLGSASLPVGPISCSRSSNYQSGRLRTARLQVRFLPGVPFCRVSPTTRGAPLRTERLGVEIPHAAPIWPT